MSTTDTAGDDYERAAAHESVQALTGLDARRTLAWLAENHPAQVQAAVQAVRQTFAAVTGQPTLELVHHTDLRSAVSDTAIRTWWTFDPHPADAPAAFPSSIDARRWADAHGYTIQGT